MPPRPKIAVIGAGISGLTAAWRLMRLGADVRIFEAGPQAGGVIRTEREQGFLVELGPNTILLSAPAVAEILAEFGLDGMAQSANPAANRRFLVRGRKPLQVPSGPGSLLVSPLLSAGAKLRLLTEPFNRSRPPATEESVAALMRRRLGSEIVDYIVNPFLAGIYAGDPERMSASYTVPTLCALEARYGSLVRGGIASMREKRRRNPPGTLAEGRLVSFPDGLGVLPAALAAALGDRLMLRTRVTGVQPVGSGWRLRLQDEDGARHETVDAVICAAPAHALGQLGFEGQAAAALLDLAKPPYAPIAVVANGFRREDVAHPLDGFGMLVPAVESLNSLGTLFSSTLFPGRAPAGHVLLTTLLGGRRQPALTDQGDAAVAAAAMDDLRRTLGVRGSPVFSRVFIWKRAIPQYELGHGRFLALIDQVERANPGFLLTGNYRSGVAVGDSMVAGYAAADTLFSSPSEPQRPRRRPLTAATGRHQTSSDATRLSILRNCRAGGDEARPPAGRR